MLLCDGRPLKEKFDQLWDPLFSPDSTKLLVRAVQQGAFVRLVLPLAAATGETSCSA